MGVRAKVPRQKYSIFSAKWGAFLPILLGLGSPFQILFYFYYF
jgi:hypothetical protein